jgi:hypothetical protein
MAEPGLTAPDEALSRATAVSKSIGGGCRLYSIVADAGDRARSQAWISCDQKKASLLLESKVMWFGPHGSADFNVRSVRCSNVYWCGTGNVYLADPSGTQEFWGIATSWAESGTKAASIIDSTHF